MIPLAPIKIGSVTVQGSIRSCVEGWRWFEGQTARGDLGRKRERDRRGLLNFDEFVYA
jgi:hypothetical protein